MRGRRRTRRCGSAEGPRIIPAVSKTRALSVAASASLLLALFVVLPGMGADEKDKEGKEAPYRPLGLFTEVLVLVRSNYVEPTELKPLLAGSFSGMTEAMDPFSEYVPPDKMAAFAAYEAAKEKKEVLESGIVLARRFGFPVVVAAIAGSPAASAGVTSDDVIEKVDGQLTRNMALWELESRLSGKAGGRVRLAVVREGKPRHRTLDIVRAGWTPAAPSDPAAPARPPQQCDGVVRRGGARGGSLRAGRPSRRTVGPPDRDEDVSFRARRARAREPPRPPRGQRDGRGGRAVRLRRAECGHPRRRREARDDRQEQGGRGGLRSPGGLRSGCRGHEGRRQAEARRAHRRRAHGRHGLHGSGREALERRVAQARGREDPNGRRKGAVSQGPAARRPGLPRASGRGRGPPRSDPPARTQSAGGVLGTGQSSRVTRRKARADGGGARGGRLKGALLVVLGVGLGASATFFVRACARRPEPPASAPRPAPAVPTTRPAPPGAARPIPTLPSDFEPVDHGLGGVLAIVIDDVGFDPPSRTLLASLEGPLALAVIPNASHGAEAARLAREKGWDLLVQIGRAHV